MPAMIIWIERPFALAIHERQLAEHGGVNGARDENLLDSALARPQQLYAHGDPSPDLADLAASLALGLARNHPFIDGNKRTAAVACEAFIMLNGGVLDATNVELYPRYIALAEGSLPEPEFAAWLRLNGAGDNLAGTSGSGGAGDLVLPGSGACQRGGRPGPRTVEKLRVRTSTHERK